MPNSSDEDDRPSPKEHFEFDCKHLLKFCKKFKATPIEDHSDTILEIKLKDLEGRYNKVDSSYEAVILIRSRGITPEYRQEAAEKFESLTEEYYSCSSQILDQLKIMKMENANQHRFQSTSYSNQPINNPTFLQDSSNCIKLPPCDTEIFEGSYEQWPSFKDMFTAVYINHSKLSPVTKLYHLRNKTKGEAGAIVKRYTLSHENFDLAWGALKSRYENKRVLVDNQIKVIFNISPAVDENSESIRRIQSSVNDSLATLRTLNVSVDSWDPILIRLISTKLPEITLSLWEQSLSNPRELPTWQDMSQFLIDRYEALERIASIRISKDSFDISGSPRSKIQTYVSQENLNTGCKLCKKNHPIKTCSKFQSFTPQQRIDFIYKNKFCINCLSYSHLKANCTSKYTCQVCRKPHHTLLHLNREAHTSANTLQSQEKPQCSYNPSAKPFVNQTQRHPILPNDEIPHTSGQVQANFSVSNENVLLRTALIEIEHQGELFTARALIDSGSQRTFITEKLRSRLQLPYHKARFEIIGIGGQKQSANRECEFVVYAKRYDLRFDVRAIVMSNVTKFLPAYSFEIPFSEELTHMDLADPNFNKSSQIDLILGNDYERFVNLEGTIKNICSTASAYNTVFGWVLCGPMQPHFVHALTTSVIVSETAELNNTLKGFWQQEEIPNLKIHSEDDIYCEQFYRDTIQRHVNGKYIVKLPFKKDFPHKVFLGSSRFLALAQYTSMEKTLSKNPDLKAQYKEILTDYLTQDHMEETSSDELVSQGKYNSFYLPHHAIVRPDHKTTKVRIVFNASRKTKSQYSLNDVLYSGPILQNDVMSVILNWRKYRYVFSADIEKMYRQILVDSADRPFQKILFQMEPHGPVKDFQLKTVTFGVNCAPFLAIRTLLQIANDYESSYPNSAYILRNEMYVDDILSGGHSIEEAISAQGEITHVLKSAGMNLRKFTANDPQLLAHIPQENLYDYEFLKLYESSSTKTLGIKWNAVADSFSYNFTPLENPTKITKRQILSSVAKLFDPAGWLAPVTIKAKLLMQQLWLEGLEWDDEISADSLQKWNSIIQDMKTIEKTTVPRWLKYTPNDAMTIIGFSDASKLAYCATVYVRVQSPTSVVTNLLVAKSKVAPIQTVCLPRLELNGAVLLARLINYVTSTLNMNSDHIQLWTDSSIVLGWLSKPPATWETYVANRTAQVHNLVPNATWRYVSTHDNPADLGTRGCKAAELEDNTLWWQGPAWLAKPPSLWPNRNPLTEIPISGKVKVFHSTVQASDILENFSDYNRALRVVSYISRFIKTIKNKTCEYTTLELTQNEVKATKVKLINLAQKTFFHDECLQLCNGQTVSNKSSLKSLNPFFDSNSTLRVNGRLSLSSLPYNERHPIILPGNSRFCELYLAHLHRFLQHGGYNQMGRLVQTEFYISRLKPRIKTIIRHCKTCLIFKQQPCTQIMGPLPLERCQLSPPFQVTGIDFAGPFELKASPLRKSTIIKGYVCVFVCFSTRAVHLEACSDLTSAAFQAAFDRFVGRRGLPKRIMSDNGRNFIGASRVLLREFNVFIKTAASDVAHKYITYGFEWKFIPPHAPHMGGLWEAAVKSFKFHFKRIAGAHRFNYEEFSTILARIEGVLNSRPISALSEDPTDLTALTPGHFLRGAPLMALPEKTIQDGSVTNRWVKLKALQQQFAIRWKEDYLKSLHKRYKWKEKSQNVRVGDLVVVMDDIQPPYEWRLGRIVKVYQGQDGHVRAADIRISSGVIKRPIVKLCHLPFVIENDVD